jgi:hypothetical protein
VLGDLAFGVFGDLECAEKAPKGETKIAPESPVG